MTELELKINNLKNNLYSDSEELVNIDKISMQKNLFELIRECIKEREYIVDIGSYEINVTPSDLSVKYETDETTIEISNEDVYYESTREVDCRYFVVSNELNNEYPLSNKAIRVTGIITNIDGICEEHYEFELLSDEEDNIKNYLTLSNFNVSGASYSAEDISNNYSVIIKKEIKRTDKRTDVIDFFLPNKVIPVIYDYKEEKYIREESDRRIYNPGDYSILLPTLDDKKNIINYLYSSIVEYYTEYINNNL